ncbi:MAG: hypothetical protein HGGPFJEG_00986 [Ignavibacteria bacterium]|nr:hypothetical protein [Ignavibacteria bacterium]
MPKLINLIKQNFPLKKYLFIVYLFICNAVSAQVELIGISNPVYDFLKRMQITGVIPDYNSSLIPKSGYEIVENLKLIKDSFNLLSKTDKKMFSDFEKEFEYDMYKSKKLQYSVIGNENFSNIFNNDRQKHLFFYFDSNFVFSADIKGALSQRNSDGDSLKNNSILLGDVGIDFSGTLFNSVGFFLNLKNGNIVSGNDSDISFAAYTDPSLRGNPNFYFDKKNYNSFEGHLRYQTNSNWLSLTFGRASLLNGKSFIDNLFLSDNSVPFDFGKIDLQYKSLSYSFFYGSIKGDTTEIFPFTKQIPLNSKNIVSHYLNINFSPKFRMGLWESVIISNQPFSFTYLNPVSFLTSADLSTGKDNTTENNSLIGIDMEILPFKNISFQSSLLIDDLTFGTLFDDDSLNENKFGWQFGLLWENSLNMKTAVEFTHLDPFVYSHRSNKSTFTHYELPLGHSLPPNSDEIAVEFDYDITNRLNVNFLFRHQRSGEGIIVDSAGVIKANYGGNIYFGEGDAYLRTNNFLDGNRVNRDFYTVNVLWEPIKQYFVEGKFQYSVIDNVSTGKKFYDKYYFASLKINL